VLRFPSHVLCHLLQHRQQLLLVIGILRHRCRHDDLRMTVHRCLPVVSLHETLRRPVFHDAGFRIGEIPLRLRFWFGLLGIGHLWRAASELLALRLFLPAPLFQLRFRRRLLDRGTFPGFLLQCRLGLGDLLQSALPPRQLRRQFISPIALAVLGVFGGVVLVECGFSGSEPAAEHATAGRVIYPGQPANLRDVPGRLIWLGAVQS